MKKQYFVIQLLLLFALLGCDDDDEVQLTGNPIRISAQIAGMNFGDAATRFRGGAGVGMFITDNPEITGEESFSLSSSRIRNAKYMQSADGLVGDKQAWWGDAEKIGVVGYYPWHNNLNDRPDEVMFTVSERQDSLIGSLPAFQESDLLWGRTVADANAGPVELLFKHLMSKVVVYLKSDAVFPGDMVGGTVKIQGVQMAAKVDMETGRVVATGEAGEIVAAGTEMLKTGYELAMQAVVVPQTVEKGVQFLEIKTLGGYSYTWTLPEEIRLESGKQLTLEVEVVSGECHVTIGEITDWTESGTPVYGEAIENLPVFEVFDLYDINGIRGMVISTNETGKHGIIMSLDELESSVWAMGEGPGQDTDLEDGMTNMEVMLGIDPTLESFPAMKWCMDKNPDGVVKWYLPAENELKVMLTLIVQDLDLFNQKLEDLGGSAIYYDDYWEETAYYWTSSYEAFSKRVSVGYCANDWWSGNFIQKLSSKSILDEEYCSVRAFYKF